MKQRLTSSLRLREAGLLLMRVASLGAVVVFVKDAKVRDVALQHLEELVSQHLP